MLSIGFAVLFSVLAWAVNTDSESMIWGGVGLVGIGFVDFDQQPHPANNGPIDRDAFSRDQRDGSRIIESRRN